MRRSVRYSRRLSCRLVHSSTSLPGWTTRLNCKPAGGSILTTPMLVYVMDFDPKQAIAASLFVVAVTSAFGLIQHNAFMLFNAAIGLLFLRRANRELFGSTRASDASA